MTTTHMIFPPILCLSLFLGSMYTHSQGSYPILSHPSIEKPIRSSLEHEEHHFKLERNAGDHGLIAFFAFLDKNLADIELGAFNFKTTDEGLIKKFYFDLREKTKIRAKIQSTGFYKFEFFWKIDEKKHVYDIGYRFDDGEKKNLNLDTPINTKPIIIKYRSI